MFFNVTRGYHKEKSKLIDNRIYVKIERIRSCIENNAGLGMRQNQLGKI
jgi:hypothetical protein